MNRTLARLTLGLLLSAPAFAQVAVSDPWVRGTIAQQKATGAFMTLTSPEGARLVEVKSMVAGVVEIHEMTMDNQVMKMRQIPGLDLPPGKPVELKPGGYHVMLMDLKQPMKVGEAVPLTLVFEDKDKKRQSIEVKAVVRPLTAGAAKMEHKH